MLIPAHRSEIINDPYMGGLTPIRWINCAIQSSVRLELRPDVIHEVDNRHAKAVPSNSITLPAALHI